MRIEDQDQDQPTIEEVIEDQTSINNDNNTHSQPVILEIDSDNENESDTPQKPSTRSKKSSNKKDANPYAVVLVGDSKTEKKENDLFKKLRNTEKQEDDSSHSFADKFVPTVGSPEFSSPEPSAPPMDEEELRQYEEWGRAQFLGMRLGFPKHQQWHEHLRTGGTSKQGINPVIKLEELPCDNASAEFLNDVLSPKNESEEAFQFFKGLGNKLLTYSEMHFYSQKKSGADSQASLGNVNNNNNLTSPTSLEIDEVSDMIRATDESTKQSYVKSMIAGTTVQQNSFIVLADKGGTGTRFQLWGQGLRKSIAGTTEGQSLNYVGSETGIPITTDYFHVPNRLSIVRINSNEIGFVASRKEGTKILRLNPGRYFIEEHLFAYIGKATLAQTQEAISIKTHDGCKEPLIKELTQKIKIINVPLQHVAFVRDGKRTYVLPYREEPYILDERRGEFFLNFASTNEKVIAAKDKTYTIVNRLLPGEFILFTYNANEYVWQHSEENSELNTVHLPASFFAFDGVVHNNQENRVDGKSLSVISLRPSQSLVLRDTKRNIRFMEEQSQGLIVLRRPWQVVDIIATSESLYQHGSLQEGNNVSRAVLKSNEWALTVNREGRLQLLPPLLDGPQYFRQPEQTFHAIVDKTKEGCQEFNIPGLGKVSIVNLISGNIGSCRFKNINFFIGPQIDPYVFAPPNQYIATIDMKQTLTSNGDLHRIYLKPGERAVIDCDGELIELPTEAQIQNLENQGNGIYVFRARNLNLKGPAIKGDRQSKLTPIEYINVGVGEVGYGYVRGEFKIWGPGEHKIDNRKEEYFKDFFSTSVDPVEINNFKITSKHTITSHIDILVSYNIVDPKKALESFSNRDKTPHEAIHEYIASTTQSEVLGICSKRPPIGYTDLDFDAGARKKTVERSSTDESPEDLEGIQSSFADHVKQLFDDHGIRLSDIKIRRWDIDPEFVKKSQEIAIRLQEERSKNEQEKILLERQKTESEKKLAEKDNEASLRQKETAIKLIELEASKNESVLRARQEAEVAAAKQVAEANAKAEMAKADAAAKIEEQRGKLLMDQAAAESQRLVAEKAIETEKLKQQLETLKRDAGRQNTLYSVETKVQEETAGAIAQAKAEAAIAESQLASAEANSKVARVKADTKKYEGLVEAEIKKANSLALNPDLTAEQRVQLQTALMQLEATRLLAEALLKSGTTMPGLITLNPEILRVLGMQGVTQTTTTAPVTTITSQNSSGIFGALASRSGSGSVENNNNAAAANLDM